MKHLHVIVGLALVVCGTVIATGAVPFDGQTDELGDDSGIHLQPADTPNGDRYAEIGPDGKLRVSITTIPGTESRFNDVFVVGYEGIEGSNRSADVWIGNASSRITIVRMDNGNTIEGQNNSITLAPNESVRLGVVADVDSSTSRSFVENITYESPVSSSNSGSGAGSSGGGSGSGAGGGAGGGGTDAGTGTGASPDGGDADTETDTGTDSDTGDTESGPDADTETDTGTGGLVADSGDSVLPGLLDGPVVLPVPGTLSLTFGWLVLPWYVWVLFVAVLTVVADYLTQTRLRGVLPLLETPAGTKQPRFRYALGRLGLLWLVVLVLTQVAMAALWTLGFQGMVLFVTLLSASVVFGVMLGYWELPEIEGRHVEPVADGRGGERRDD